MTPLAIDLFCGLGSGEPELLLRANAAIKKFVARRAKNPNHGALRVRNDSPRAISFERRLVGNLKNAGLSALLTGSGKIRVFPAESSDDGVLEWPARVVDLLNLWVASVKGASLCSRSLSRTVVRAISPVRVGWDNIKMLPAAVAVTTTSCHIGLFKATQTTGPALTSHGAIALVETLSFEAYPAFGAKQFMHVENII